MKKTRKNILGLAGFAVVAATTVFAASLPGPTASAMPGDVSTMTDTITVKVVESTPLVELTPVNADTFTGSTYSYNITYNWASPVYTVLTFNGQEQIISTVDPDYDVGTLSNTIDLSDYIVGTDPTTYGEYKLTVYAIALDGTPYESSHVFSWVPVIGQIITVGENTYVKIDSYDPDTVNEIRVYAPGVSEPVAVFRVPEDLDEDGRILINLDGIGCQPALYMYAYDVDGNRLYDEPYTMTTTCPEPSDTGVPDTGGIFQNLNISKEDYLITGLIVFFVVGIVGVGIVARTRRRAPSAAMRAASMAKARQSMKADKKARAKRASSRALKAKKAASKKRR